MVDGDEIVPDDAGPDNLERAAQDDVDAERGGSLVEEDLPAETRRCSP